MPSYTGSQRAAARRTVWTLPPRLSRIPKRLSRQRDLAVGQSSLLVEFDDGGLRIGSQLSGGGAEGVGRLQGMTPLNPAVALAAPADVDVELPMDGLSRDLDLELLGDT